jgi:uncharacterized repeat protein (TIGR04138 family)
MKVSGFQEAVAQAVSKEPSYSQEGYEFLRESLEATLKRRAKSKQKVSQSGHVTAMELLDGFRTKALKDFGPMSTLVLDHWGIRSCADIGRMVFLLVEAGAFGRTESDSVQDFEGGFDFHEAFVAPFLPASRVSAGSPPTHVP